MTGCASGPPAPSAAGMTPEQSRNLIEHSLPAAAEDRPGWAADMYAAFSVLGLDTTRENVCAVVAVIEQESGFRVDPVIAGLPTIA